MVDRLQPRQETAVEALEIAMRSAREEGRLRHATALADLRDGLLARLTPRDALRAEADVEFVLIAMGSVTHPGQRVSLKPAVLDALIAALRGQSRLKVSYGAQDRPERDVERT